MTTLARRAIAGPREASPRSVLVVMCVGYFLVLLDVTIVNVALPQIGSGIGASVSGLQWVVDGYALALAGADSAYLTLLPAFLLWGIGLGILNPAVVAAAIAAVPGDRAGLASAINNTARQAGGAIGIAIAGAVAGQPGGSGFVTGFHGVAIGAACLYVIAAALALALIPGAGRAG